MLKKLKPWRASFLCAFAALMVIVLAAIIGQAASPPRRTTAALPDEHEITFDMSKNRVFTSDDGIVVIGTDTSAAPATEVKNTSSQMQKTSHQAASYALPEEAALANGSIGRLTIPAIRLAVDVFETDSEMEAMSYGLAHFKTTSSWDSNIGLCGHNVNLDGSRGHFYSLHTLKPGDKVTYKTALGERVYEVQTVKKIDQYDWSYLDRNDDNRVTMITCITGKPNLRLMVQAVEK